MRFIAVGGGVIDLRDEAHHDVLRRRVAPFAIADVVVTRGHYAEVLGQPGPDHALLPQTDVSWFDAVSFCNAWSERDGLTPCYAGPLSGEGHDTICDFSAGGYRLPTEAEWEMACRAGSAEVRYGPLEDIAWFAANADDRVHEVAQKAQNAWGLYDTIGNVWEWCWDLYDPAVYGPYRVFRGGGFADPERGCRASCRRKSHPTFCIDDLGFRVVRTAAPDDG